MRAFRALTGFPVSIGQPWLPGVPHALVGLAVGFVFGIGAAISALLLATLVNFVIYLPLTALALNGGEPIGPEDPAPVLPVGAQVLLLALWTITVWGAAALTR